MNHAGEIDLKDRCGVLRRGVGEPYEVACGAYGVYRGIQTAVGRDGFLVELSYAGGGGDVEGNEGCFAA